MIASENITPISNWSSVYKYSIPIIDLNPNLVGKNILHLSDVHFLKGDPRPLLELQHLIDYLSNKSIRFSAIVFTGDLITKLPDDLCSTALRLMKDLSQFSNHNFFVLGNHDYHGKVPEYILKKIEVANFYNLTNSTARVRYKDACINFCGVDDAYFGKPTAPSFLVNSEVNIALVHNLDAIRSNFPKSLDLILSGHTHWGEIKLPLQNYIPIFDGAWWMNKWGYYDNINKHSRHWDIFNERSFSFVHPGLARYYTNRIISHSPGFVIHSLENYELPIN
jgi:predicted MPP superfamily phosphohydrolase